MWTNILHVVRMEAALGGCEQDGDVFLWLISPHGAVPPGPHPTPMTDAAKGIRRQTPRTVKVDIYHLPSYRSYKREDTCALMMLAAVEKRDRQEWSIIFVPREGVVQSILASLPRASKRITIGCGRELEEGCVFKFDLCREGCGICELRGGKISGYTTVQATPLPGTAFRAGLQALVCRGRRHFSNKKKSKMSKILAGYIRQLYFHNSILSPHHCLSSLVLLRLLSLTGTEPRWGRSFRQDFKINHIRLGGKYLDVFYNPIVNTPNYKYHQTRPAAFIKFVFLGQNLNGIVIYGV